MGSLGTAGQTFDVLLRNGNINGSFVCDIGIQGGVITALGLRLPASRGTQVIDCEYAVVTPGGIDGHVHLSQDKSARAKEAGYVAADTIETGTRSAVAGGTTTVILFAEQSRGESVRHKVAEYHALADQTGSYADYGFHAIITDPTPEVLGRELPTLARDGGITSMKLFLTYEHMRISDAQFLRALQTARALGMVALVHAENGDLVDFFTEQLESLGLTQTQYKAVAHPSAAEAEAVNRAVTLSAVMDTPMLVVHVSAKESMRVIRRAQSALKPVFAETCPQYLLLGKQRLAEEHFCGAKYVCSPPLRSDPGDIEAVWQGIANGTVTIFSSDHCPYRFNDPRGKQLGRTSNGDGTMTERFTKVPNGLPGVETRMPLLFSEGVLKRKCIDVKRFVELTSENPAKLYGLYPRKGTLQVGSDADVVIWHPQSSFARRRLSHARDLHDACDYSPYEGIEFWNWPRITLLRGSVVFRDGQVVAKNRGGRFVKRQGCSLPYIKRMGQQWDVLKASI